LLEKSLIEDGAEFGTELILGHEKEIESALVGATPL